MAINKRLLVKPPSTGITPSEHFGVVLYKGNSESSHSINGGKFGGAALFNGSSSTIVIPNAIEQPLKGAKEFGVSMWFNLASLPTGSDEDFLISLYQEGYLDIRVKANGVIQGKVAENSSGTDRIVTSANSVIAANTWYHVVWTGKTNDLKLYINGSSIATGSTWNGTFYHSNAGCRIGSKSGPSYYFNGKIDQTRIFQKQLSSSEVTTLYTETVDTVESLTPLGNETIDTLQVLGDTSCTSLYRFENDETDLSGNYDGTGTKIQYAAGRYGQAIKFGASGNNSYLDITKATTPTTSSISFWLKTSHSDNQWRVIADGGGSQSSGTGWAIFVTGNGAKINPYFTNGQTGYSQSIEGTKNIADGVWHHVVLTMASDNGFVLYLDGQSHLSGTRTRWTSGDTHSVSNVRFGNIIATTANANNQFYGEIDQIRTFNKSLSSSEVTTLYQESPLIASYRFEGNANDDMRTYDGTVSNVTYEHGLEFTPDFVWIKARTDTRTHSLVDSSRGFNGSSAYVIQSDGANAQWQSAYINSLDQGGFTVSGTENYINNSSHDYVAWCWKANGGTTSSNTDGNITSTVQLNADAGFAITTVTGSGSTDTFGHGLGTVPEVMIRKDLSATDNWTVYTTVIDGSLDYMRLNLTDAAGDSGYNMPTSTVFTNPGNTNNYIYYSFVSIDGFSKFATYTGNGSTDGPIVEIGFEPAFLMIKKTSGADRWMILDNKRSPIDPRDEFLDAQDTVAESVLGATGGVSFLSNGFQLKSSDGSINGNSGVYMYMAFAADPDTEAPAVAKSFSTVAYTGNGGTNEIDGLGFSPSFVWLKDRDSTNWHTVFDTVRGPAARIHTNSSNAQDTTGTTSLTSFDSDGFTLGSNANENTNGNDYVAWAWKANDNEPTALYDSSAISAYKFEDNANDVGGSYNGSTTSVTYVSGGKFNKAVRGVASNSKVALNYTASGAFTFSLWIYNESTSGAPAVIAGMGGKWVIGWESNKVWMLINDSNRGSGYTISTNTWYHVAATYNGSGTTQLYVDGTLRETITSQTPSSLGSAKLFSQDLGYWSVFAGRIDQVRIYSAVLNSTQISALYNESTSDNSTLEFPDGLPTGAFNSLVSANANAGFSIVKYEGTGSAGVNVKHGLSSAPTFIMAKTLESSAKWRVYHSALGGTKYLNLNDSYGAGTSSNVWNDFTPTATKFQVGSDLSPSGEQVIAYCFHDVAGFSKFGSYSGTGSSNSITGLGFQPDWLLVKEADGTDSWEMYDSVRGASKVVYANGNNAEVTGSTLTSFDSNGFTVSSATSINENNKTYVYMAFKIN